MNRIVIFIYLIDNTFTPKSPQEIVNRLFFTVYLGSENSTQDSRARSRLLAEQIGSKHYEVEIDQVCKACTSCIKPILKKDPQFIVNGGSLSEDLALQNIQARSRMILTYLLAQLTPWNNGKKGFLIVLGSSNLDESIRGFLTKYDCSSADIIYHKQTLIFSLYKLFIGYIKLPFKINY